MKTLSVLFVGIVALIHINFLILEMFLWQTPFALKLFEMTPEQAQFSAPFVANHGLYNGFLAAGLLWGLIKQQQSFLIFFLGCIIIAGTYGGIVDDLAILFTQALPATIALLLVWFATPHSELTQLK